MSERIYDPEHENLLKTALGLREQESVPDDVADLYFTVRRTARRLDPRRHLEVGDLLWIVTVAQRNVAPTPKTVDDLKLEKDELVKVKWRNAWVWGRYQSFDAKTRRVTVILEGSNPTPREVKLLSVQKPTPEELKKLG